jgi:hypothetical protein
MTSQNAFVFFPKGCMHKEGLLLGVNITEFEIVVLDVVPPEIYQTQNLDSLLKMPNLTTMNQH